MRHGISTVLTGLLLGCAGPEAPPVTDIACDPGNGGLDLPDGFCALVVADELGRARHLWVTTSGDIYVAIRARSGEGQGDEGGVVALRDTDGDGRADVKESFGERYGTGIEVRDGYLYYAADDAILRYPLTEGQLAPTAPYETVIDGFPEQRSHAVRPFAFDESGHIFVNVGGPSNACQEQARTEGSPGVRPCPQRDRQASIWRFDADRTGQSQQADGYQYSRGIRNSVAIAWDPGSKSVYVVQHGRDQLHQLWPALFDEEDSAEAPAEEFLKLEDGADFKWPYCYYDPRVGKRLLAPEFGGDGVEEGECAEAPSPPSAFPGHWAPNDLVFYTGRSFPEKYRGGAFIAFHGSWNRAPLPQKGYNVAFVPMRDGELTGDWEVFADGFKGADPLESPQDAAHRPTGLAQGPDGSLYISDSVKGKIWRVIPKASR